MLTKDAQSNCIDQPGITTSLPIRMPTPKINKVIINDQTLTTINLAVIITSREVGNASNSFAVWSENSRPNTQIVMIENKIMPPAATACARKPKKDAQSAVPVNICALVLISPMDFAASGSFKMIMNNPPANGAMQNPIAVNNGTLERIILRVSTPRAEEKLFI